MNRKTKVYGFVVMFIYQYELDLSLKYEDFINTI